MAHGSRNEQGSHEGRVPICLGFALALVIAIMLLLLQLTFQVQSAYAPPDKCSTSVEIRHVAPQQQQQQQTFQQQQGKQQGQQEGRQQIPPKPPGGDLSPSEACPINFPWIDAVVKQWFQASYQSARSTNQTSAEALQAIKDIRWDKYSPGIEQITLRYNSSTQRVDMVVTRVTKPNQPYKPVGMVKILEAAVEAHNAALAAVLKHAGDVHLLIETEDFPLVFKANKWKLPAFAMCASPNHIDIPVPDFTFHEYPEAGYTNTSWHRMNSLLQLKGRLLPWQRKQRQLFMRHHGGVGYRKVLMPWLLQLQEQGRDVELLGAPANVKDTGFVVSNRDAFVFLDEWCNSRYLLHTAGFSYSAGLKYKMACGAMVFNFLSKQWSEFYYPALQDGVHYVAFQEEENTTLLEHNIAPKIKQHVEKYEAQADAGEPAMAKAAREWVAHNLSRESLSCYWYRVLLAYIRLYTAKGPLEVPEQVVF